MTHDWGTPRPVTFGDVLPAYYFGDDPVPPRRRPLSDQTLNYSHRASIESLKAVTRHIEHDAMAAQDVARHVSLRRAAGEPPELFVRRIALAMLTAAIERAAR